MAENSEFKILILPGELNSTPNSEDLILLVSQEEFMRMWQRGQTMLQNYHLNGRKVNGYFKGSLALS